MHKLKPITALGADKPQIDQFDGLEIAERPDFALASLAARQGAEAQCAELAKAHLGFDLPAAGQGHLADPHSGFWMGADQWMISAPQASHEDLAAALKTAVGDAGSVSEQTDGWCRFDLSGSGLKAVMERLCNADLASMALGDARRVRLEHLGCFIWCLNPGQAVAVLGPRSSAASLHHALVGAAKSAL
ncbi:sarcosine oxidase, gamma subunit [Pseudophaeobacter sp.]|uniref:sarcosine oxidase subunit gamma n=1 Tax=Pseudophaeobacter sp. TaxID=1971739 RepID=UPI003297A821